MEGLGALILLFFGVLFVRRIYKKITGQGAGNSFDISYNFISTIPPHYLNEKQIKKMPEYGSIHRQYNELATKLIPMINAAYSAGQNGLIIPFSLSEYMDAENKGLHSKKDFIKRNIKAKNTKEMIDIVDRQIKILKDNSSKIAKISKMKT